MRALLLALALAASVGEAFASCEGDALPTRADEARRAVAPVYINGAGPFRFIVDTGANRSVISAALAQRLGIAPIGQGEVHSVTGVETAPLASVDRLEIGALTMARTQLPLLDGPVLAGEHGLLGFDGMAGRRLYLDFERDCVAVEDANTPSSFEGWTTLRSETRFGSLIVVEGAIQGVRVNVMLDTGSDISLANSAFRRALGRVQARWLYWQGDYAVTAGRPVMLDNAIYAPRIRFGDAFISGVTAYIGDYHIFSLWGLEDEPTILVGMDVLADAGAMAIDYERGLVHFRKAPRGMLQRAAPAREVSRGVSTP